MKQPSLENNLTLFGRKGISFRVRILKQSYYLVSLTRGHIFNFFSKFLPGSHYCYKIMSTGFDHRLWSHHAILKCIFYCFVIHFQFACRVYSYTDCTFSNEIKIKVNITKTIHKNECGRTVLLCRPESILERGRNKRVEFKYDFKKIIIIKAQKHLHFTVFLKRFAFVNTDLFWCSFNYADYILFST